MPAVQTDANSSPRVVRHLIHAGVKFDLELATRAGPGGEPISREVVRHPGAVIVLPVLDTPSGPEVVLIRNWRVSLEAWLWELPAGTLGRGEDPAACAARELTEETGYVAATLEPLCRFYTSPGLSDELMWAFVGRGLAPATQRLEVDERITVHPMALEGVMGMMRTGELLDAKSMVVMMFAERGGVLG